MRPDAAQVILASASRARAAIFSRVGIEVGLSPAAVDEAEVKVSFKAAGGSAGDAATALAELKASRIAANSAHDAIVLGADQMLTCGEDWFDKPVDRNAARSQLKALSGQRHELHTSVVAYRHGVRVWHHLSECRLWMRPLSSAFLDQYLDIVGDDVYETVGGYHIERLGPHLFTRIEGDHFAILGLPLLPTLTFLRDQGVIVT